MYIFSHHFDLWRDLTLKISTNGIDYQSSWKDTYAHMVWKSRGDNAGQEPTAHVPLVFPGFCSDLMHRTWACRVCDLESCSPGFSRPCTIKRVEASKLSVDDFVSQYEVANIPVIITGLVTTWPAFKKWDWEYLAARAGNKPFRATSATASSNAFFTVEQYKKYCTSSQEEAPLYFFDKDFIKAIGVSDDYTMPPYFDSNTRPSTDLFRVLGENNRPDYRWLILGPKRSGSMFHIDPNQTHAWNAAIRGRKKWLFYPPGVTPPGVMVSQDMADVTMPISTGEWTLSFWAYHLKELENPDIAKRPLECITHPGELIFVPHGWWHMVINLDETTIALTHNYMASSNIVDCLDFLKNKSDQITGLRDRYGGGGSTEGLYHEIVRKMEEDDKCSQLLKESLDKLHEREEVARNRSCNVLIMRGKRKLDKCALNECDDEGSGDASMEKADKKALIDKEEEDVKAFCFSFM